MLRPSGLTRKGRALGKRILDAMTPLLERARLAGAEAALREELRNDEITYAADSLVTSHTVGFKENPGFLAALAEGRGQFQHSLYHEYRLYLATMLCSQILTARKTPCFVECGVGEGHTMFVFAKYAQRREALWAKLLDSTIVMMDTFAGVDLRYVPVELQKEREFTTTAYHGATFEVVKNRFAFLPSIQFVKGPIPDTLSLTSHVERVDFLHLDMNNPYPEVEALKHFLPRMTVGGCILLDDYAFKTCRSQFDAVNDYCDQAGSERPMTLPTGQGLLVC
jgi:hypothetical protein